MPKEPGAEQRYFLEWADRVVPGGRWQAGVWNHGSGPLVKYTQTVKGLEEVSLQIDGRGATLYLQRPQEEGRATMLRVAVEDGKVSGVSLAALDPSGLWYHRIRAEGRPDEFVYASVDPWGTAIYQFAGRMKAPALTSIDNFKGSGLRLDPSVKRLPGVAVTLSSTGGDLLPSVEAGLLKVARDLDQAIGSRWGDDGTLIAKSDGTVERKRVDGTAW
jgi:hypothetical protein